MIKIISIIKSSQSFQSLQSLQIKMRGANSSYWGSIWEGISSLYSGLKLTLKHFFNAVHKREPIGVEDNNYFKQDVGIVTLQYPRESFPVPDNGRYRLHNEIDDCIVCDLCAKICPVNCIEIEPVKSTEEIGKASDGTTKRIYAAKFDIDMAKCCYCGLCTTVCPTECLTMTKTYDFSEFDVSNMIYHFSNLSPEEGKQKQLDYEEAQRKKAEAKVAIDKNKGKTEDIALKGNDVSVTKESQNKETKENGGEQPLVPVKKPPFKPVIKPPVKTDTTNKGEEIEEIKGEEKEVKATPKPVIKPIIKPVIKNKTTEEAENKVDVNKGIEDKESETAQVKPKPKPIIKPVIKVNKPEVKEEEKSQEISGEEVKAKPKPKPVIKPIIKPRVTENKEEEVKKEGEIKKVEDPKEGEGEAKPKPKPIIKPVIKARKKEDGKNSGGSENTPNDDTSKIE